MERLHGEGRIEMASKPGGRPQLRRFLDEMPGVPVGSVWTDIPPVNSQAAEDTGYPTQKPESLLARIVRASSREGDIVLDCFAGAGTTCAVAEKLGRRWIAVDCGKLATYTMQKRMLNLCSEIGNGGSKHPLRPFTFYNAGLYDFSRLRELPWESWRFFALQLFQCRDEPHRIGGIELDGRLKGASVLVFNHMRQPGVRIDEETIESLHQAIGSKVGARLFIIAPALTFDFQQDYIDQGDVRYYALRIPYSIIHELHNREFTALKQPADEMQVNDTVEAVGFDFIRTPELKFSCGKRKPQGQLFEEAYIRVTTFKSEAMVGNSLVERENLETMSMVMLDYDYDEGSQVFDLDAVFYGESIRSDGGHVRFRPDDIGDKLMAVFIDIYGNEARVLIESGEFGVKSTPKKGVSKTVNRKTGAKKKKGAKGTAGAPAKKNAVKAKKGAKRKRAKT
jgi:site-specific DNA-methyltransferase (adenine-specific)/adenine-specific DNA-methyltransferase